MLARSFRIAALLSVGSALSAWGHGDPVEAEAPSATRDGARYLQKACLDERSFDPPNWIDIYAKFGDIAHLNTVEGHDEYLKRGREILDELHITTEAQRIRVAAAFREFELNSRNWRSLSPGDGRPDVLTEVRPQESTCVQLARTGAFSVEDTLTVIRGRPLTKEQAQLDRIFRTVGHVSSYPLRVQLHHEHKSFAQVEKYARSIGLTETELMAVQAYVGSDHYRRLNEFLRNPHPSAQDRETFYPLVKIMNRALAKFPEHKGWVDRGASAASVSSAYVPGAVVLRPEYTSSSITKGYKGDIKFKILSKHGKKVMNVSHYPEEQEVLFRNNTYFKVLSRTPTHEGGEEIRMIEVDRPRP